MKIKRFALGSSSRRRAHMVSPIGRYSACVFFHTGDPVVRVI